MQEDIKKKEEEVGKEEQVKEEKEEHKLEEEKKKAEKEQAEEKEEAEKELEESELTQERPAEGDRKKYLKFATRLIPGAIAPIIAVFLYANNHPIWGIPFIMISFGVVWLYDGSVSGTFVYLIAAGSYGFWQGNWFAFIFFIITYIICIATHFIRYFPAIK